MSEMYCFQRAQETDIARVMEMIEARIRWMDACGIEQWNKNGYLSAYPEAYYREELESRRLYVLRGETTKRVYGALVLRESDENWDDGESALYVNNLVADLHEKGAGLYMLSFCDVLARAKGKSYLRLEDINADYGVGERYTHLGLEKLRVLCDGVSKNNPNLYSGRTEGNKIVFFEGAPDMVGGFVNVRIERTEAFALWGKVEK